MNNTALFLIVIIQYTLLPLVFKANTLNPEPYFYSLSSLQGMFICTSVCVCMSIRGPLCMHSWVNVQNAYCMHRCCLSGMSTCDWLVLSHTNTWWFNHIWLCIHMSVHHLVQCIAYALLCRWVNEDSILCGCYLDYPNVQWPKEHFVLFFFICMC